MQCVEFFFFFVENINICTQRCPFLQASLFQCHTSIIILLICFVFFFSQQFEKQREENTEDAFWYVQAQKVKLFFSGYFVSILLLEFNFLSDDKEHTLSRQQDSTEVLIDSWETCCVLLETVRKFLRQDLFKCITKTKTF